MKTKIDLPKLAAKDTEELLLTFDTPTQKYHYHSQRQQWSGMYADFVTGNGFTMGQNDDIVSFLLRLRQDTLFSEKSEQADCYPDKASYEEIFDQIINDDAMLFGKLSPLCQNQIIAVCKALEKQFDISPNQAIAILAVTSQDILLAPMLLSQGKCGFTINNTIIKKKNDNTITFTTHLDTLSSTCFPGSVLKDAAAVIEFELVYGDNETKKPTLTMESFHLTGNDEKSLQIAESLLLSTSELFEIESERLQSTQEGKSLGIGKTVEEGSVTQQLRFATSQLQPIRSPVLKETVKDDCPNFTLQFFQTIGKEDFAKNDPVLATTLLIILAITIIATAGVTLVATAAMAKLGFFGSQTNPEQNLPKPEAEKDNSNFKRKRTAANIESQADLSHNATLPALSPTASA